MNKIFTIITFFFAVITANAQDSIQHKNERIKVDGVAVVIGKNIVLDSDIEKFKKELQQRIEGKIEGKSVSRNQLQLKWERICHQ